VLVVRHREDGQGSEMLESCWRWSMTR